MESGCLDRPPGEFSGLLDGAPVECPEGDITAGGAVALDWHEAGLDFADAMHLAASGDVAFRTFDRHFIKQARKLTGCPVEAP